jgi:hypothetical protein
VVCVNALTIKNTGNVRLRDVVATGDTSGCTNGVLAPGETLTCTVVRGLTDANFVASGVTVGATVTANPSGTNTAQQRRSAEAAVTLQQIRTVLVTLAPSKPDSAVVLAAGESQEIMPEAAEGLCM